MKVNWNEEKTNIEKLIKEGVSYERIGRQYGVTGASVKKAAKKLGIELEQKREINPSEHFNRGKKTIHKCLNCGKEFEDRTYSKNRKFTSNKFCSHSCQQKYKLNEYIKKWKNGEEDGLKGKYGISKYIRSYLIEKNDGKCQICGWGEINKFTGKTPLHIHHIDGDCTNNKEENLQLLCPNCHSLTENFGSLNKNSKRFKKLC